MADQDGLDRLEQGFANSGRISAEFEAELARLRQSMLYTGRETGQLAAGIGGGLRRAFDGLALDGMKLSDALKGIARSLVDTAYSIAMKPVQQALGAAVANGMNAMIGGIGAPTPFARGGVFTEGRVMPFARGGIVSQPTHFPMRGGTGLMGEAGPEAIMPLRRGADGRLGVAAAGSAGRAVNVTINVSTPDVAGFSRSQSQIAQQMRRALARGERNS
ncbi:phage tail tape measure protein [Paracoccus sp. S-4012]|uniref:phage tail tape measure protein n=1 Tax=Paracoccus sp. S-4012 TaxID=2665648 RepID=UPI0012AF088E|nr:phage tail tape measure protein [Paracoccus sp. S-4012]MRX50689.1 phage tail tape measure protein [Paracoccus sp. S-4012]